MWLRFSMVAILISMMMAVSAKESEKDRAAISAEKTSLVTLNHLPININNTVVWMRSDGLSARAPGGASGVIFPRGKVGVIYRDGLVWGGIVQDPDTARPQLRVGGSTYISGLQPGNIITSGTMQSDPVAADPNDPQFRVWRIRRDWETLSASDPQVILDAGEVNNIDTSQVTPAMAQALLAQYQTDWENWPVDLGAPYYDNNENGSYDPTIDEPGIAEADQVLWLVVNDMDTSATNQLYGSPPIGIECQITMWGYNSLAGLENTVFRQYKISNKSAFSIEDMYLAQWADPDIGQGFDDVAGSDSTSNIAYAYNGFANDPEFDAFGLVPAAAGYGLLKGPAALPMTSFTYWAAGSPISGPQLGSYTGTRQWYQMLKGFKISLPGDEPYTHGHGPFKGNATFFPLNGDPVTLSGDVDAFGDNLSPGDRKTTLSTGPFDLGPGENQVFAIAVGAGIGSSNRQSVNVLKGRLISAYNHYQTLNPLGLDSVTIYPLQNFVNANLTEIQFTSKPADADSIALYIYDRSGPLVATVPMFDDGLHNDGFSGDGIFGVLWTTTPRDSGLTVDSRTFYKTGEVLFWKDMLPALATMGPVEVTDLIIGSDNLNHNQIATVGENVRFTLEIHNGSTAGFQDVRIEPLEILEGEPYGVLRPPLNIYTTRVIRPGRSYSWPYHPDSLYYEMDIVGFPQLGDSLHMMIRITDDLQNAWYNIVPFRVEELSLPPSGGLMSQVAAQGRGLLGFQIIDPDAISGETYQAKFTDTTDTGWPVYEVRNMTTGVLEAENILYPDELGHNSVATDGFKVTRGTTELTDSLGGWEWNSTGGRWLRGVNWGGALFFGGVDFGRQFFGSNITDYHLNSVKIVFDSSLTTTCAVFRRDLVYAFAGLGTFYGAAYDISDSLNQRRVNIMFVEDNNSKPADLIWNPDSVTGNGAREYLFIMDSDYDSLDGGGYNTSPLSDPQDNVWAMWADIEPGFTFLQSPAELILRYEQGVRIGDTYQLVTVATGIEPDHPVLKFSLAQNYPNPFNPQTTIVFALPKTGKAKLEIFNVLGQKVKTLVDHSMTAGEYTIKWNGRADGGYQVASGIYFYRLTAGNFVQSRKMILIR